ncbi:MAG: ammonia channel protein [Methylophilaceae bacterium]|nr:MAG: ammonia channel protein [Methylophilaceae bacterium]
MKKLLSMLSLVAFMGAGAMATSSFSYADEMTDAAEATMEVATEVAMEEVAPVEAAVEAAPVAVEEEATLSAGDTGFMIIATVLVILMTIPGLALFYSGLVRAKNMLSVLMQVFVVFAMVSVIWAAYGYSLAFTEGNAFFGDFSKAFLAGITADSLSGTIPEYVFVKFQLTFAAITPALIVGAFAERIKFSAVLLFTALWVTLVYIPVAHMVWGGGFLSTIGDGAKDFAGGTVVHINAGVAALVAALMLGKRIGYGKEAMPPHNLVMTMVGAALLWVGWFGFNVGSELAADGVAGLVLINTQLATAAAVMGWVFAEWLLKGKPSMLGAASGAVAGLVAVTPACGFIGPMGAIILGFLASFIALWGVTALKSSLGYDDSLDVFGVHGLAGIFGAMATGVLMAPGFGGVGYGEGVSMMDQVTTQAIAVAVTIVWSGVLSFAIFKVVDVLVGLRVSEDSEREGLDTTEHGERAYNL